MYMRRWFPHVLALIVLALSLLACDLPIFPSPTRPALISTATPPAPTPTPTPTVPPPTVPATLPPADWLPAGTIALYVAGPWDNPRLYTLAADASAADLGQAVHTGTTASRTGRWIAYPGGPPPANAIVAVNLEDGTTHTTPAAPGFDVYGMAFDAAATRLAFLEVGPPAGEDTSWAIVVVNLGDGSTTRFEATVGPSYRQLLPGFPIGWSAPDDELLLGTFMPYSEYGTAGVWAITLPPEAVSLPLDVLFRRELLPGAAYTSRPRLSPGATHLLYLARDPDYTPADYEPIAYDLAVNQLWTLDLASGTPTLLVEVTDGGALGDAAAWSPDGAQVLFAQGNYAAAVFASLTLKVRDWSGTLRDVGTLPLPPQGGLSGLDWCTPDLAFATVMTAGGVHELHAVDLISGAATLVASDAYVSLLGCVP